MTEPKEPGDAVLGETLLAWGRKVSRIRLIPCTSAHRAQSVSVQGMPATCRIDKRWRVKR